MYYLFSPLLYPSFLFFSCILFLYGIHVYIYISLYILWKKPAIKTIIIIIIIIITPVSQKNWTRNWFISVHADITCIVFVILRNHGPLSLTGFNFNPDIYK